MSTEKGRIMTDMDEFEKALKKLITLAHSDGEDETSYDSNETIAARRVVLDLFASVKDDSRTKND